MGGGDEVDIVGPLFLEVEHHGGELFVGDRPALGQPRKLVILAEKAFQVAARKKDRPGALRLYIEELAGVWRYAARAANGRLLAVMKQGVRNGSPGAAPANTQFAFFSVDAAFPGAERTARLVAGQIFECALDSSNFLMRHRTLF